MFKNLKNDIRLFQVFYVVAKTSSVSKASELLYISQPAVSYHIKVLEENFNAKLFYRTTHGVVLTPLGETIFPYMEIFFMDEKYIRPYEITDEMLELVSEIMENLGKLSGVNQLEKLPRLRRVNRIKSIHSSLAIENNTLSIEQVTDVIDGRRKS